ncbi:MAG: hypothetical protein GX756_01725 [Clostridiales bacterium]|jgi:hypothetical protein|nr:hypothetical protein [Clostridiales bacterium]
MKDDQDFLEFDEDDFLDKLYKQDESGDSLASDNVTQAAVIDEDQGGFLQTMADQVGDAPQKTQDKFSQAMADKADDLPEHIMDDKADDTPKQAQAAANTPEQAQAAREALEQSIQEPEQTKKKQKISQKTTDSPKKIRAFQK